MKNIIYCTILSFILISCNNSTKQVENPEESAAVEQAETSSDTKTTYDRNLANFKAMLDAWNNQDVEAALNLMADDFMETGTIFWRAGSKQRGMESWK